MPNNMKGGRQRRRSNLADRERETRIMREKGGECRGKKDGGDELKREVGARRRQRVEGKGKPRTP